MGIPIDLTGQRFGRLVAQTLVSSDAQGRRWLFHCDCGESVTTRASAVRYGKAQSCGCLQKEKASENASIARAEKQKNAPSLHDRFWSKVERLGVDDCWRWLASFRRKDEGYGAFHFKGRHHPASRMAWIFTHGNIEGENIEVCHSCDNPRCCNPRHLFLGDHLINNDDKVSKGRHAFGERSGTAKLTEKEAIEIKRLKPTGRCPYGFRSSLAAKFNVSSGTITDIWTRSWTHLD